MNNFKLLTYLTICLVVFAGLTAANAQKSMEINQSDIDALAHLAKYQKYQEWLKYDQRKLDEINQAIVDIELEETTNQQEAEEAMEIQEMSAFGYFPIPGFTFTGDPDVDTENWETAYVAYLEFTELEAEYEAHGYAVIPGFEITGVNDVDDANWEVALELLQLVDPARYDAIFNEIK